jgi:hypothetical protein
MKNWPKEDAIREQELNDIFIKLFEGVSYEDLETAFTNVRFRTYFLI